MFGILKMILMSNIERWKHVFIYLHPKWELFSINNRSTSNLNIISIQFNEKESGNVSLSNEIEDDVKK